MDGAKAEWRWARMIHPRVDVDDSRGSGAAGEHPAARKEGACCPTLQGLCRSSLPNSREKG